MLADSVVVFISCQNFSKESVMKQGLSAVLVAIILTLSPLSYSQVRDFNIYEERMLEAYLAYYGRPADSEGLAF